MAVPYYCVVRIHSGVDPTSYDRKRVPELMVWHVLARIGAPVFGFACGVHGRSRGMVADVRSVTPENWDAWLAQAGAVCAECVANREKGANIARSRRTFQYRTPGR